MEKVLFRDEHSRQIRLQHFLVRKGHHSKSSHRYLKWENIGNTTRNSRKVLLEKAIEDFSLRKKGSWIIGEREGDLLYGLNGNPSPLLVMTGQGKNRRIPTGGKVPRTYYQKGPVCRGRFYYKQQ